MYTNHAIILFVGIACAAQCAFGQQSDYLLKSVITTVNSKSAIVNTGTNRYLIQQSSGQAGITSAVTTEDYTKQQGFLNNIIILDNGVVDNQELSIYPNPVVNDLNIYFKQPTVNPIQFTLFDVAGRLIRRKLFDAGSQIEEDISVLEQGIYIVRVVSGESEWTRKIIKGKEN